jgi:hypothetical protein
MGKAIVHSVKESIRLVKSIKGINEVLPTLLVLLTHKGRYLPEIEWCDNLWTHNIFRAYERLFWRRQGARLEQAVWTRHDKQGKQIGQDIHIYTFEALCANTETFIRGLWPSYRFKISFPRLEVFFDQLAYGLGLIPVPVYGHFNRGKADAEIPFILFALAVDTTAAGGTNSTTVTVAVTTSGSDRGMIGICGYRELYTSARTFAYAASNGTFVVGSRGSATAGNASEIHRKIAPATGANNATLSGESDTMSLGVISFTGADQTNLTSASTGAFPTTSAVSFSLVLTGTGSYSVESQWVQSSEVVTQDQSQTEIFDRAVGARQHAGSYKAHATSGSKTLGYSSASSNVKDYTAAEVLAQVAVGPTTVKTWNGITQATQIKTYQGVALANVKSVNGAT